MIFPKLSIFSYYEYQLDLGIVIIYPWVKTFTSETVWSAGAGIFYPEMFHLWVATITVMVLEEDCRYGLIIKNKSHSRNWGGVEWNDQFKSALHPKRFSLLSLCHQ
jgi:hypothetical protein